MRRQSLNRKERASLHNFICLICRGRAFKPKLLECADRYLRTPFVVDYGACITCGLVQQVPVPDSTAEFHANSDPMHASRAARFGRARKMLIRGCYFAPRPRDAKLVLLDFGCGDGAYLASIDGQVGRRIAFDAAPGQAARIGAQLGIAATADSADRSTVPDASVDIVTAHFVLENLTDLAGTFAYWQRILKKGGRLHLAVPNIHCFEARLFGRKWHGLDAPRHISFPAESNLAKLAKKHGFRIVKRTWGIFPATWAASLATVVTGNYQHPLFLLMLPLGVVLSWLMPQSTAVYSLVKVQ